MTRIWKLSPLLLLVGLFLSIAQATADDEPLRVEEAFRYTATADAGRVVLEWEVADGYYLYRPRFAFKSQTNGVLLEPAILPKGKEKEDEFFGKTEVYRGAFRVEIPYTARAGSADLTLQIKSQGCADMGLCYPPQTWATTVALPGAAGDSGFGLGVVPDFQSNDDEFLDPDTAFRFFARMQDDYTIRTVWEIADGYYLYKDKFAFEASSDLAQTGQPRLGKGKEKHDEFFGDVEVYYGNVHIDIPISRATPAAGEIELTARFQGCAEDGICYPPLERTTLVAVSAATTAAPADLAGASGPPVSEQDRLATLIDSGSLPLVLATFFGLGLLLAFTPCVLPMVPILSSIIAGQGPNLSTRQSFVLSLIYVLAMALTYTIAGVIVALLGKNVQAMFQNVYVLAGFSLVFVALALAMFDVYELQMPTSLQTKLTSISNRQSGGRLGGVAMMGVLSALIVGPCVAAPLVGVLIFIGQSGDAVRGGLVLFALSLGMGAPLLAFGATAGRLMVKAGPWMTTVKYLFGIMLLGVAVWLLSRVLPGQVILFLWAALAIGVAVVLGVFRGGQRGGQGGGGKLLARAAGVLFLVYGVALGVSATLGGSDPLNLVRGTPWDAEKHLEFELIKTVDDLDAAVARAAADGRPVMLDFYADWCVSCKEMEKYTFTDNAVQAALTDTVLLQADVTLNDAADQALLKRFGIYGPPTIAFFDRSGREQRAWRVVGFMKAEPFAAHAAQAVSGTSVADR